MPPELTQWIPPAVIIALMIYLHRSTHRRLDRMEGRLESRMDGVEKQIGDLRNRLRRLQERMARLEGTLDVLRDFFVRNGRGTAA